MSQLLQDCIAFIGDVDTVGAIALDARSCSAEITQDIPNHLVAPNLVFQILRLLDKITVFLID